MRTPIEVIQERSHDSIHVNRRRAAMLGTVAAAAVGVAGFAPQAPGSVIDKVADGVTHLAEMGPDFSPRQIPQHPTVNRER